MVSLPQISKGIITFIEQELIIKGTSKQKFVMYFVIPQIPQKVEQLFDEYKTNMLLDEFIKEDGIDIDAFYRNAKNAIQKSGSVDFLGIIFNESDMDKLYGYISRATV